MIVDCVQRWTERREARRPTGETIRPSAYDVVEAEDDTTPRAFVERHHYSGSWVAARFRFLLYQRGDLAGVAVFSVGASGAAHRAVWPTLAQHPVARVTTTGARVFPGHVGTIYQATNGRYIGRTNAATLRLLPDGRVLSNRAMGKLVRRERGWRGAAAELERFGADVLRDGEDAAEWLRKWRPLITRPLRHTGNHRYVWCLDDRRRRELTPYGPMRRYPKIDFGGAPPN